jgi:hypothetical protein
MLALWPPISAQRSGSSRKYASIAPELGTQQGLQAAVLLESKLFVVGTDDVSICSAFPMHQQGLGPVRRALRGSKFKADAMDL